MWLYLQSPVFSKLPFLLSDLPMPLGLERSVFSGVGRHFGSRFFAEICGALKVFVPVAGIRSDAF
jgi:hypothetical protein